MDSVYSGHHVGYYKLFIIYCAFNEDVLYWAVVLGQACAENIILLYWAVVLGRACAENIILLYWAVVLGRACAENIILLYWAVVLGRACAESIILIFLPVPFLQSNIFRSLFYDAFSVTRSYRVDDRVTSE
jgi:hypothetical protein